MGSRAASRITPEGNLPIDLSHSGGLRKGRLSSRAATLAALFVVPLLCSGTAAAHPVGLAHVEVSKKQTAGAGYWTKARRARATPVPIPRSEATAQPTLQPRSPA